MRNDGIYLIYRNCNALRQIKGAGRIEVCFEACGADALCKAFHYSAKAKICGLKSAPGTIQATKNWQRDYQAYIKPSTLPLACPGNVQVSNVFAAVVKPSEAPPARRRTPTSTSSRAPWPALAVARR